MAAPLKIMHVITRLNIGGPARHVVSLVSELQKKGFQALLVCGRAGEEEGDMAYLCEERGVKPVLIPRMGRAIRPFGDLISFFKIIFLIRREGPLVLHTHTSKAGFLGRLASLFAPKVCRIHTFHGHVFSGYFGPVRSRIVVLFERLLARKTAAIVAVGDEVKKDLLRYRIAPADKIHVVPPASNLQPFFEGGESRERFRAVHGFSNRAYLIGLVGRMVSVKGHALILRAATSIVRELPQARFVFVGDGPLKGSLIKQAEESGLSQYVHFLSFQRTMSHIYAGLDLVALPSLSEGLPLVAIEALASGLPLVASRVGSLSELLQEDCTGTLIPPGDTEELTRAILYEAHRNWKAEDREKRRALARKYDIRALCERILELYKGLCEAQDFTNSSSF